MLLISEKLKTPNNVQFLFSENFLEILLSFCNKKISQNESQIIINKFFKNSSGSILIFAKQRSALPLFYIFNKVSASQKTRSFQIGRLCELRQNNLNSPLELSAQK